MIRLYFHFGIKLFNRNKKSSKKNSKKTEDATFVQQAQQVIDSFKERRAKSTIDNYRTALRSITRYAGEDLTTDNIDNNLLESFQRWLTGQGVCQNTISCYMRSLRSIIFRISPEMKNKVTFEHVYTGKARTEKRSIPLSDVVRIRQCQLPKGSTLAFARDIFMFSIYALGMPFVDIAYLRKPQLSDGYITYFRHKTSQRIRIRIESPMQQIINRYTKADSPYVFPILTSTDKEQMAKEYETARTRYNRHLRELGRLVGTQRRLTSYVARHSWASMAYHANVELSVISKALGHTSPNTTLTYIREIDDNRIDRANKRLLRAIR